MERRAFLNLLAIGAAAGLPLDRMAQAQSGAEVAYDLPRFGNVSLLHFTDCHAQLKPI